MRYFKVQVLLFLHITFISLQVMSNLLYYCGMCGVVKELLLKRYFSKVSLWA
uniref:Uncharacterized protein n=1 Tax=Rhizophora mucronata TaxID=61149 RepID=A0A2P2M5D7_RHIMU